MRGKPILFSAPMINALLAGTKTQTRRKVNVGKYASYLEGYSSSGRIKNYYADHRIGLEFVHDKRGLWDREANPNGWSAWYVPIPFYSGQRLWVREAWRPNYSADGYREDLGRPATPKDFDPTTTAIEYLADGERELGGRDYPSIHMPRWASRITLIVKDVRVERLQDINEDDARAEGVERDSDGWLDYLMPSTQCCASAAESFLSLWESINGEGSWSANPWVAVVEFSVIRANIDAASTEGSDA